jgi:hypothetical protein
MFSEPLEKIVISAVLGIILGAADAAGFFLTVKLLLVKSAPSKKIGVVFFEFFRLLLLIALIIFLGSNKIILYIPLLLGAFVFSMGGKMLLIFKGIKRTKA